MLYVEPPFELGQTLRGKDDNDNLINKEILGKIFMFPAQNTYLPRDGKTRRVGKPIYAVALRNESGATLYGKRVALCTATAGYAPVTSVDGYAAGAVAKDNVVIIDEFLATAGVADDDIFWGIISGPVHVLLPLAGADFNGDFAVGAAVVNSTGTTTGATTSGRISNVVFTAATAGNTSNGYDGFRMGRNMLGIALSAATTQQTTAGQQLLIDARIRWR
jgi:hypothetical protein